MTSAGHHTMLGPVGAPTAYRYVAFKIAAIKAMRSCASLTAYNSASDCYVQVSELQFQTSSGTRYDYPSGFKISSRMSYNGTNLYQDWVSAMGSTMNSGENTGRLFDNSTSTKLCSNLYYNMIRNSSNWEAIRNASTSQIIHQPDDGYAADNDKALVGVSGRPAPIALVLDLDGAPLDITVYSQWRFNNANDNESHSARTVVEGEILGSADLKTWWRLDVFNNANMPTTNYAVAYIGNLIPRKGDIWSGLDLSTRDWTNGISVDSVGGGGLTRWLGRFRRRANRSSERRAA